ncbi:hypothetical protein EV128_12339 [Rhizobium azibense]|nr:hypothetical protein EV128_12339 [Rhizobium azibense]
MWAAGFGATEWRHLASEQVWLLLALTMTASLGVALPPPESFLIDDIFDRCGQAPVSH